MERKLLHVYRNTPLGRETLLQSVWFCRQADCQLSVYIPHHPQFLIFLQHGVVSLSLDESYLRDPDSARDRVLAIVEGSEQTVEFVEPVEFTAPTLPTLDGNYKWMACPRSMSEISSKIRFGHLGPRVRTIVKSAPFPVLLPTPVFKPWKSIVCSYGGSENSIRALNRSRILAEKAGVPLSIFTQSEGQGRGHFEAGLEQLGLLRPIDAGEIEWIFAESGPLESNLFQLSREALVVVGAHGGGIIHETLFGSKLEIIQTELPNNLLVVGPEVPALTR